MKKFIRFRVRPVLMHFICCKQFNIYLWLLLPSLGSWWSNFQKCSISAMYQPAEHNLLHTENIFKDAVHLCEFLHKFFHDKSWLFPTGFSQGIRWARRVSQGPEELSLNTWIAFNTLWNINPYCFTQLISSVANLCESFSDRFLAPRLLIDAVVRLCKSVF